jgi:DnaK suppressor protein
VAIAAKKPASKPESSDDKKAAAKKAASAKQSPEQQTSAAMQAGVKPAAPKSIPESAPLSAPEKAPEPMKTAETKTPAVKPAAKSRKKAVAVPQSDVELMAMPESDYMNDAQLAYFKAKLSSMRDEILENARETGVHLKENEVFADPNDRATVEEENLLEQRVRDRERKLLKKINASLARIEAG